PSTPDWWSFLAFASGCGWAPRAGRMNPKAEHINPEKPMSTSDPAPERESTPGDYRPYESKVELCCRACGKKGQYAVGRIFIDPETALREEKGKSLQEAVGFSGYFHCRHCGAGGPWDLTPSTLLLLMALQIEAQARPSEARIHMVRMHLF